MNLDLDRLTLHVPGLTHSQGQHLARLVAWRLVAASAPATALVGDRLEVKLETYPGEHLDSIADKVVAALVRAMEGSSW